MNRRTEQGTNNKGQGTPNNGGRRKGDDIAARILDTVEGVRQLLPALEVDAASKHVAKQLWRAITLSIAQLHPQHRGYEMEHTLAPMEKHPDRF